MPDDGGLPQLLKDTRKESGLTLEKIEAVSLVQKKYLLALEEGRYWDLPGEVYGRQFLRAYAKCLSVNAEVLVDKFDKEYGVFKNWQTRSEKVKAAPPRAAPKIVIGPWFIKRAFVLVVMAAFLGYLGLEIKHIVSPPVLIVDSPTDNLITSMQVVEIKGWVEPESKLSINGQEIYSDRRGNFLENIGLQSGVNIIHFAAKKKYGKESVVIRKVMVQEESEKISQAN